MTERREHRNAFEVWYRLDRSYKATAQELGGSVSERTLYRWAEKFGWGERADNRDKEAARIAEKEIIKKQAELQKLHAKLGEIMVKRSLEHFVSAPITRAADATAAAKIGIEIQRMATGLPAWMLEVAEASDDELYRKREELLRRMGLSEAEDAAEEATAEGSGEDTEEEQIDSEEGSLGDTKGE